MLLLQLIYYILDQIFVIKATRLESSFTKDRKKDHIDLAFESATGGQLRDDRFYYEPLLTTFPETNQTLDTYFLGKPIKYPIWVSSMTGGTGIAKNINRNLATACKDFGLGMGLGSCRKLLSSDEFLEDFAVRPYIGDQPLYANLGIAQLIGLISVGQLSKVQELVKKLEADGIIIHVNPIQEWMQPEGDKISGLTPIKAIEQLLATCSFNVIVKEVGQGMGPESLSALLSLPLAAIEFGAFGGTNFAKLEALRDERTNEIDPICFVGHTPLEMIESIIDISKKEEIQCKEFIISGSVKNYLDGYFYNEILPFRSVYGQAAGFLKHALNSYDELANYVEQQTSGYAFAMRYLKVKSKFC